MLLDVKPIHFEGMLCIEESLITILAYMKKEYPLLFAHTFGFEFFSDQSGQDNILGKRISYGIPNIYSFFSLVELHYGVKAVSHTAPPSSADEMIKIIKAQIDNQLPVIININMFWCPWLLNNYQKQPHDHYCLAIGYDSENLLCVDPILSKELCRLPYENYAKGFTQKSQTPEDPPPVGFYITVTESEAPAMNYNQLFMDSIHRLSLANIPSKIRKFADAFLAEFDFAREFKDFSKNFFDVFIHRNIGTLSASRSLYISFLNYIFGNNIDPLLTDIITDINLSAVRWDSIRGLLTKYFYTEFTEKGRQKIYMLLTEMAILEERIILSLLKFINASDKLMQCQLS